MAPHPPFEVRPANPGETMFRILESESPRLEDFLSDEHVGRLRTLDETQNIAIYRGISVRATLTQARNLAKLLRKPIIAEVLLVAEEGDCIARTLHTRGHHTVWGAPERISQRVLRTHQAMD